MTHHTTSMEIPTTNLQMLRRFVDLAAKGLVPMFDHDKNIFCYKLKQSSTGLVQEGTSARYTMMCLLGFHRYEQGGNESPVPVRPLLDSLLSDLSWVDNVGDIGVVFWTCATIAPDRLSEIARRLDLAGALDRFADGRQRRTMELAWLLIGLSNWALVDPQAAAPFKSLTFEVYDLVSKNRGKGGYFGHLSRRASAAGMARGWIGSFADQVYPIYGLTRFWQAFDEQEAAHVALDVAEALCDAQGPQGQWWWHYDSTTGRVVDGYPVFSVHQHAMAPMTLFAVGDALRQDFRPWIYKGLQWINGDNELGFDMENSYANLIWRCQQRADSRHKPYLEAALNLNHKEQKFHPDRKLEVLYECRPYELGWLLYAFAARLGQEAAALSDRNLILAVG
jgi:hypothetical protein